MKPSRLYQVDLNYDGCEINLRTAPCPGGWSWSAIIDHRIRLDSEDGTLPSPEIAMVNGRIAAEDFIEAGADPFSGAAFGARVVVLKPAGQH